MSETVDVKMVRVEEQMKTVISSLGEAKASRDKMDAAIEKLLQAFNQMDRRMEKVEIQMTSNAPTIEEFITIKHKVSGAGLAGKWAWSIGGALLAAIFFLRESIRNFFLQ